MKRKRDSTGAATTSACVGGGDSLSGIELEVFLNFRGSDTRLNFTDCLYHFLVGAGIRVFRDEEEIPKGEKIGGELLLAIQSSKIYVPILSRNYASSVWCLRELTHMVECSSKANDKAILPIFYDVDPDDVKLKTRLYLDALEKHEEKFGRDEVRQWKEALTEVARIKGWGLKDKGHGEIINTIVDEVLTKLKKRRRNLPSHLVGIAGHVEAIMNFLNEGSSEITYMVIHGLGGIGLNGVPALASPVQLQNTRFGNAIDVGFVAHRPQPADPSGVLISPGDSGITTIRLPKPSHEINLPNAMHSQTIDFLSRMDYTVHENVLPSEPPCASISSIEFQSSGTLPLLEGNHAMEDILSIDLADLLEFPGVNMFSESPPHYDTLDPILLADLFSDF
ncbi:disease resistance protein L6-like [Syzygium oleosum]|uniref:disease resistance protein L6-like n=1 Tax=Syzygium oleosum TaxID=219896 RepID=UPI0024B92DD7|nr:disease resistance protein L6-like [Syzygium oleosum]